jgi:hypothetical protein
MRKRIDRIAESFRKGTPIDEAVRAAIVGAKPPGEQPPPGNTRRSSTARARKSGR